MKRGQSTTAKTSVTGETKTPSPPIEVRLEQGYIIARCGEAFSVYELLWQSHHGDAHKQLVLRECVPIPRQFEREAFGERS